MMYRLEKNTRGMITSQCRDGEAGNIYANREAINKKAIQNLEKNTPDGKLGVLSNLQVFNFNISNLDTGTKNSIAVTYNGAISFPNGLVDGIMFSEGKSGDGLYYNIVGIQLACDGGFRLLDDSWFEFFLLQNSTQPMGTYLPRKQGLFSASSGGTTFNTTGDANGNQFVICDFNSNSNPISTVSDSKGFRASGLGLKRVFINLDQAIDVSNISIDVAVTVDISSVSRTY